MKYFLHKKQANELKPRIEFLWNAFHLYFVRKSDCNNFICLQSFPFVEDDPYFITAHDKDVYGFLEDNPTLKGVFVLNTCNPSRFERFISRKRIIYIAKQTTGNRALLRPANEYNIGFDVLDSELLLLHSKELDIMSRISKSYNLLTRE